MKEKNKKYTAADFDRYHSGSMPPVEMRALEQAALEDPFLAEALDGYAWSEDHEKELKEIETRLQLKKRTRNFFSSRSGNYWKIAAMIVLIAGAGYIFYLSNDFKGKMLASVQEDTAVEIPAPVYKAPPDTTSKIADLAFESRVKKDQNVVRKEFPSAPKAKKLLSQEVEKEELQNVLKAKVKKKEDLLREKMESASLKIERSKDLSFISADTVRAPNPSAETYFADSGNDIAIQKENAQLREVVVTAYGQKRKAVIRSKPQGMLEGKVSGVAVTNAGSFPEGGREAFDKYILDSAQKITDSAGHTLTGNILLGFTINKKGKPARIEVLESDCKPCEKEAIRLLIHGPRWKGNRRNKTRVWIKL